VYNSAVQLQLQYEFVYRGSTVLSRGA